MARTVQILLATYNGEEFLQEQLDSLFGQSCQDFEVLVGDDGSIDSTLAIIDKAVSKRPHQIRVVYRAAVGGAARNFMRLVASADAPYVMFCDQDDVWLADKVSTLLAKIKEVEAAYPTTPVLVHSDLAVVDQQLRPIHPSFFDYQRIDPARNAFADVLLRNCATGCAAIANRNLVTLVKDDPADMMYMHDWWFAIAAAARGRVAHVAKATVLYRQHESNAIGARPWNQAVRHFSARLIDLLRGSRLNRPLRRASMQAQQFLAQHGNSLSPRDAETARRFGCLVQQGFLKRRYTLLRYGLLRQGALRNLVTLLLF